MSTVADRRRLRAALKAAEPWVADPDLGPAAVAAGTCDRCRDGPRIVVPCGPEGGRGWCRRCLVDRGLDGFCAGHAAEAADLVARARDLPATWATLTRLAWVARGELRADAAFLAHAATTLRDHDVAALVAGDGA